jgi:hypothetical protein
MYLCCCRWRPGCAPGAPQQHKKQGEQRTKVSPQYVEAQRLQSGLNTLFSLEVDAAYCHEAIQRASRLGGEGRLVVCGPIFWQLRYRERTENRCGGWWKLGLPASLAMIVVGSHRAFPTKLRWTPEVRVKSLKPLGTLMRKGSGPIRGRHRAIVALWRGSFSGLSRRRDRPFASPLPSSRAAGLTRTSCGRCSWPKGNLRNGLAFQHFCPLVSLLLASSSYGPISRSGE